MFMAYEEETKLEPLEQHAKALNIVTSRVGQFVVMTVQDLELLLKLYDWVHAQRNVDGMELYGSMRVNYGFEDTQISAEEAERQAIHCMTGEALAKIAAVTAVRNMQPGTLH
jgi:hypothetical protein